MKLSFSFFIHQISRQPLYVPFVGAPWSPGSISLINHLGSRQRSPTHDAETKASAATEPLTGPYAAGSSEASCSASSACQRKKEREK